MMKRESTGIKEVDSMMQGGLPANSIVGISGPPGVGKSIFCLHFLLEGARLGQKCVYVNLEEPKSNIDNLIAQFEFSSEFKKFVKSGKIVIQCHNYTEFENIYSDFFQRINEENVQRLVVDSFNVFFTSIFSSKDIPTEININKMINKAVSMLRKDNMTTMLILEKHKDNYNVPYLVDGMIDLDFLDLGTIERRLFISKMRRTDQFRESIPYEISNKGIVLNDEK